MHVFIPALHRPSSPTGVCRHSANLALCLSEKEEIQKITVAIGHWQDSYFHTLLPENASKIQLLSIDISNTSVRRNRWYFLELGQLVELNQADIVHLPFPVPFLRSRFKVPVVSTLHDLYPFECPENFGFPQVIFNQLFLRICLRNSDAIACVSQTSMEMCYRFFPKLSRSSKLTVIYNYVNFNEDGSSYPQAMQSSHLDKFLLCVAQHRSNKNLSLLLDVFSKLNTSLEKTQRFSLIIVGSDGPETPVLQEKISAHHLNNSVFLLSSVTDSELKWLYQNCELFVMPSSQEGFCLPLVEALSLGCRVVCSDIPIFQEVGNNSCSYFSLENHSRQNLYDAVITGLNQPNLERNMHDSKFTKQSAANDYKEVYTKLLTDN